MKIFLSYGRDCEQIVMLVKEDLCNLGHTVWMDTAEIKGGDDWRERITSGILESDMVLAFLSRYGLRKGGVCLDELAISVSCNLKAIKTIILEPEMDDVIPATIRGIQHIDLSEWSEKGTDVESWYELVREDLLSEILRESSSHNWIDVLRTRINPRILQGRHVVELRKQYIPRIWIDKRIDDWINGKESNIMVLSGYPGFGKSCYCANYFHYNPYVASLSLCSMDSSEESVSQLIRNIAFQLAMKMPSYGKKLLWILDEIPKDVSEMNPRQLYSTLLVEPQLLDIDGGHASSLIVIDGIDHLSTDGYNLLAEMISESTPSLPAYIKLLISTRNDVAVLRHFNGAERIEVAPDNIEVRRDIERFFRQSVFQNADNDTNEERIEEISRKCEGSFLQATLIADGLRTKTISIEDVDDIPTKIMDSFFQWMRRIVPSEEEFTDNYYEVFAMLAATDNPIHEDFLRQALGWRKMEMRKFIRKFKMLLIEGEDDFGHGTVALFHQAFKKWICDENGIADQYAIDKNEGLEWICDAYIKALKDDHVHDYELSNMLQCIIKENNESNLSFLANNTEFADRIIRMGDSCIVTHHEYESTMDLLKNYRRILESHGEITSQDNKIKLVKIQYLIAEKSFQNRDLISTSNEIDGVLEDIHEYDSTDHFMNALYMLATAYEWLGKRAESIELFRRLRECAVNENSDEYQIRALAGMIWNDHFSSTKEGQNNLKELDNMRAETNELSLMKELVIARMVLSLGNLEEALSRYSRALELGNEEIWGYDSISIKNQMLMMEVLVACFDNEEHEKAISIGKDFYARLQGHENISECYCASWLSVNYLKLGLYDESVRFLSIAERISGGTKKRKSAWIDMHLKSIRAIIDGEGARYGDSMEGHKQVYSMAMQCQDYWVAGDACGEYLKNLLLCEKSCANQEDSELILEELDRLARQTELPHLVYKNRIFRMAFHKDDYDRDYIEKTLSFDIPSTDMLEMLYVIRHFIALSDDIMGDLNSEIKRRLDTIKKKNRCAELSNRLVVQKIMEENMYGLYD